MNQLPTSYVQGHPFDGDYRRMFPVETFCFPNGAPEPVFGVWETNDGIDHYAPVPVPDCYKPIQAEIE